MPQQHARGACGTAAAATGPPDIWLPELLQLLAGSLPPTEVACVLRLTSRAAAAQFRGPLHTTIRLSHPVPHREFAWRWGRPGAMRGLSQSRRRQLPCLTARSGSLANLEVLLAGGDRGMVLQDRVYDAAAAAGQLEVCRWLHLQGCPRGAGALLGAARGGHQAVCEWLLASGCALDRRAAGEAAGGGHVGLMQGLLRADPSPDVPALARGVAEGCELHTLQRLHDTLLDSVGAELALEDRGLVVAATAASPTPDWRAKVEWLAARGYPRSDLACQAAARRPDGAARLGWLRQQGYGLTPAVAEEAAGAGNVGALELALAAGVVLDAAAARRAARRAAEGGHLAALRVLLRAGGPSALRCAAPAAAEQGHLGAVEWLLGALGATEVLTAGVFAAAARSGSVELLAWLRARGCPWSARVFAAAAEGGSEEQLEWLAEAGCPMGADDEPYVRALINRDLAMLRCLKRLGCPLPACLLRLAVVFFGTRAISSAGGVLCWLLAAGCSVAEVRRQPQQWLL
ncbi:hypothetical protein TSOC_003908 [Tetrabaena socialis]|uniref:Ankyrin repeat domain-containing protein n=1 Tax=Tetrabaena socialis TaxID=47790 RepID=A0A2J8AAF5_9CHLO|nr:hypothetical protein TSOC_003908 [Tetrabaena socialis]|eukprot:PNH09463.1 hypothetical protein TSOC_003908 [Tetrabaena socialis]